jgi:type I restriction enzyme M protein
LIGAFDYIRDKIELDIENCKKEFKNKLFNEEYEKLSEKKQSDINNRYNSILKKLNSEINVPNKAYSKQTKFEKNRRISKLSSSCIYGTDANPRMARTSKMNMIMHGDGHGGVHHHDGLINVDGIFEERFDVILTNPPFGSRIEKDYELSEADRFYDEEKIKKYEKIYGYKCVEQIKELNNAIEKKQKVIDRFELGKVSNLTEVLFMERCLKLLKKGGRMGIVLPEGVLNNSNLQKVRDYFESEAKILLITSIPQDVFIASGATIKPSLLFFKRFTDEEKIQYNKVKEQAEKEINKKYADEIKQVEIKFGKDSKSKNKELKEIKIKQEVEIKEKIKELFNYEIPIAQVEKAGITTTGAKCENELIIVAEEFKKYRNLNNLWTINTPKITYNLVENSIIRKTNEKEEEIDE